MKALTAFNLILLMFFAQIVDAQTTDAAKDIENAVQELTDLQDIYPDSAVKKVTLLLNQVDDLTNQQKFEVYLAAGQVFDNTSLHEQGRFYFNEALRLSESLSDKDKLIINSELLELYTSIRDTIQCQRFVGKINLLMDKGEYGETTLANVHYDFGTYYWYFGKYDSSIFHLNKAIQYVNETDPVDYNYLTYIKMELAEAYWLNGQTNEIEPLLKEVQNYPDFVLFTEYAKNYVLYLDAIYSYLEGDAISSFEKFDSLLSQPITQKLKEEKYNILGVYIDFLQDAEKYQKGMELAIERAAIYESLVASKRRNTLAAVEIANDIREKDQLVNSKQEIVAEREQELTISYLLLGIIVVLLLVTVIVLIQNNRSKKKVQQQNEQIQSLISELHHRVKNNLQVISSLLGLQSMKLKDEKAREAVSEGKDRINAMSLIHERLYANSDLSALSLEEYIRELTSEIARSYGHSSKEIFTINIKEKNQDLNKLMPLGLIINELVSNSFKYAFNGEVSPKISISYLVKENYSVLNYSDNGPGLPDDYNYEQSESFGLKLIKILSKQLKGDITISGDAGFSVVIQMKQSTYT